MLVKNPTTVHCFCLSSDAVQPHLGIISWKSWVETMLRQAHINGCQFYGVLVLIGTIHNGLPVDTALPSK